jgi:hypothetical protein
MPASKIDATEIIRVLRDAAGFARRMNFPTHADAFDKFAERLETEPKLKFKDIRSDLIEAKDKALLDIRKEFWEDFGRTLKKDRRADHDEFSRIWKEMNSFIWPVKYKPTSVSGLMPGSTIATDVLGDVKAAPQIAKKAIQLAEDFSEAVIKKDYEKAYALFANEARGMMAADRFIRDLPKVKGKNEGLPIRYLPGLVGFIWADAEARKEPNKDGQWPKETPIENKRATVIGQWESRDGDGDLIARDVCFWISEEDGGYRISKFDQYH